METTRNSFFTTHRSLRLSRDFEGVLLAVFHASGGPPEGSHRVRECFLPDLEGSGKQIVILTGAGGEFIARIDFSSFGNFAPHIEQAAPGVGFA